MSAKKEKIVEILERYEEYLSDGYVFYSDDVQETLLIIADEIIAVLHTNEQNGSSHNSAMDEILHLIELAKKYTLEQQPDKVIGILTKVYAKLTPVA